MTQYAFFFDQNRCYNCHACVVACRDWNDIQPGPVKWLRMLQWEKGVWPTLRLNTLFATCYHCENPVCVDACEHHALFKEDKYGAVLLDEDLCEGDRNCWKACPYGAPQYEDDAPGTPMSKCTMCYDRLEKGELPICVTACPGRALDFGTLEEMEERYGDLKTLPDMPDGELVKPAIVFRPQNPRRDIVSYDVERGMELLRDRSDWNLPDQFSYADVESAEERIGYGKLVMKSASVEEALALSKNEEG